MHKIGKLRELVILLGCSVRLKSSMFELPEEWTTRFGLPADKYIELHGPWPFREVDWLEVDPIVMEHIGRLVNPRQHDYLEALTSFLQSENVTYAIVDGAVRIPFLAFK